MLYIQEGISFTLQILQTSYFAIYKFLFRFRINIYWKTGVFQRDELKDIRRNIVESFKV